MKFGPTPVAESSGKILAHNISGRNGRRFFRKGKTITAQDVEALLNEGYTSVYTAEIEPGDIEEDRAARLVAEASLGAGIYLKGPSEGRVNLAAQYKGVLEVDGDRLDRLNECQGITFATLRSKIVVRPDQVVATVKIIPYAVPAALLDQAMQTAGGEDALIQVKELKPRRVGIVLSGEVNARQTILSGYQSALKKRIEAYGSQITALDFVGLDGGQDEAALAEAVQRQIGHGIQLVVLASETSTMDANDVLPRAVLCAGGQVACVGAPVDPGNLLMLAYLKDIPLLGVPGCARSPKENVVDWVLPALLAGDHLTGRDIAQLGYGGLLEDLAVQNDG
ncbi:MAG: molybdopterin-binding protein [Anaerolineaceae bacterium]|nr:molybdopterin-binding protein [Anaerolineaceae bacterium]